MEWPHQLELNSKRINEINLNLNEADWWRPVELDEESLFVLSLVGYGRWHRQWLRQRKRTTKQTLNSNSTKGMKESEVKIEEESKLMERK